MFLDRKKSHLDLHSFHCQMKWGQKNRRLPLNSKQMQSSVFEVITALRVSEYIHVVQKDDWLDLLHYYTLTKYVIRKGSETSALDRIRRRSNIGLLFVIQTSPSIRSAHTYILRQYIYYKVSSCKPLYAVVSYHKSTVFQFYVCFRI